MADFDVRGPMPYPISGKAMIGSEQQFADSAYGADSYGNFQGLDTFPEDKATQIGGHMDTADNVAVMSGNPYAMAAGGVLKLGGMGLSAYGKYKEREEAKKRYDDQVMRWKQAEEERLQRQAMEDKRRARQEGYFASQYSQDLMSDLAGAYGGFRTPGAQGGR